MDVQRVSVTPVRIAEESALGTYVSRFWFEQHGVVSTRIRSIFHSVLHSLTIRQWLFWQYYPLCPSSPLHRFRLLMVSCSDGYMTEGHGIHDIFRSPPMWQLRTGEPVR